MNKKNIEHVCKIPCLSLSSFSCFLSKLPLILLVGRKRKKRAGVICRGPLVFNMNKINHGLISVGFGATLRERQKILKTIFLVSGIFPGKADSVKLLGFECTINTQNLNKSLEPFKENRNFKLFSYVNYP